MGHGRDAGAKLIAPAALVGKLHRCGIAHVRNLWLVSEHEEEPADVKIKRLLSRERRTSVSERRYCFVADLDTRLSRGGDIPNHRLRCYVPSLSKAAAASLMGQVLELTLREAECLDRDRTNRIRSNLLFFPDTPETTFYVVIDGVLYDAPDITKKGLQLVREKYRRG